MTVRQAELLMAIATCLLSLALMWSSTDGLAIGWVQGKGPGSGFWPFWLSLGMLLASITTLVRWFLRATPESRSSELYMSRASLTVVGTSVGALLLLLVGIHTVGIYISLLIFLFLYVKILGNHSWATTIFLVLGVPVAVFALFEWALQIPLPKAVTEEWFYPVFDVMYGTDHFWMYVVGILTTVSVVSIVVHKLFELRNE